MTNNLEELATEMRERGYSLTHGLCNDVTPSDLQGWAAAVDAYLASRPASDLVQRMRARAAEIEAVGWAGTTVALFLEAADALALEHDRADALRTVVTLRDERITELERALADWKRYEARATEAESYWSKRAEAAEASLAELERDNETLAKTVLGLGNKVTELESELDDEKNRRLGFVVNSERELSEARATKWRMAQQRDATKAKVADLERDLTHEKRRLEAMRSERDRRIAELAEARAIFANEQRHASKLELVNQAAEARLAAVKAEHNGRRVSQLLDDTDRAVHAARGRLADVFDQFARSNPDTAETWAAAARYTRDAALAAPAPPQVECCAWGVESGTDNAAQAEDV